MSSSPPTGHAFRDEEAIEEVAANWLAEREEGLAPEREREFQRWCRADPRHAAAVARLEQACALLEKMPFVAEELRESSDGRPGLPPQVDAEIRQPRKPAAGRWLARVGIAAALAVSAIAWWQWPHGLPPPEHYATSSRGYQRVTLADGTILELNANTQVDVQLEAKERRVVLRAGEAHFTVAHDTSRPFIVDAGGVAVRAVGTAFNVRLASAAVEVLVTEGKVRLDRAEAEEPAPADGPSREREAASGLPASGSPTFLEASQRAVIATSRASTVKIAPPHVEKIEPAAIRQALSWQERKLVFSETPLRDAIEQFNRRNLVQLSLADAELGEKRVGGTFAADNVMAFARLLETSGEIVAEPRGDAEIVLRKAR